MALENPPDQWNRNLWSTFVWTRNWGPKMKTLRCVLLLIGGLAMTTPAHAQAVLFESGFGAGIAYAAGVPVYVYLPGVAYAPAYPSRYPYLQEYAYVSGYYPPRFFEPEIVRPRWAVTRHHGRLHKRVRCRCQG